MRGIKADNEAAMRARWMKPMVTYFIQGELTRRIKIGKTTLLPQDRLKQHQIGSPDKLILLATMDGDREAELHTEFSSYLVHGEWFSPEPRLLDFIKNNCNLLVTSGV